MSLSALLTALIIFLLAPASRADAASEEANKAESKKTDPSSASSYVGASHCGSCHPKEQSAWQGSHHDLAMQPANENTVLGDFNNSTFDYFGTVSTFYKKDGRFFVKTDNADGTLTEFPIAYTFGVFPLQQYLIAFPGGRYQALNVVWDSRKKADGGQRWFHLYPDENVDYKDELHWTGINQNWNYMCADCHSTNLAKNYDPNTVTYNTTWTDIDVSCEACHGPASTHLAWADAKKNGYSKVTDADDSTNPLPHAGFAFSFTDYNSLPWQLTPGKTTATPVNQPDNDRELGVCASCHSRRLTSQPHANPADNFSANGFYNNYHLSLLADPLYHMDGQIRGEVYVYGSFVQSRMYEAGVTCTNCHEPHSVTLRAEGNAVCTRCHQPAAFDTPKHHLHAQGSEGAACVNCHMPAQNFMVVDARRDHSFRIPRPDLSDRLGTPNACNQCHTDKSAGWAANILEKSFGPPESDHFALALAAATTGARDAELQLTRLITDESQPAIVRATAVTLLPPYLSANSAPVLQMIAQGNDPLLSLGLAQIVDEIPAQYRPAFAVPLLFENSAVNRALAAQSLAGVSLAQFPDSVHQRYEIGIQDFLTSTEFNGDRPEPVTNRGNYYLHTQQWEKADSEYRKAVRLAPYYTPAYINLADLFRMKGDEEQARQWLQTALDRVRDKAIVHHALGLSYIRDKQPQLALKHLQLASTDAAAPPHYAYVYALALHGNGESDKALSVLEQALNRAGYDPQIISALASLYQERGDTARADHFRSLL